MVHAGHARIAFGLWAVVCQPLFQEKVRTVLERIPQALLRRLRIQHQVCM